MATVYRAHRSYVGLAIALVAGLVVGGGAAAFIMTRTSTPAHAAGRNGAGKRSSSGATTGSSTSVPPSSSLPAHSLQVKGISPAAGSTSASGTAPIRVRFSAPISPQSPDPTIKPSTPGTWHPHGDTLEFVPSVGFLPLARVTVTVPAGSSGVKAAGGDLLAKAFRASFQVREGSTFRLQQLLSLLRYSPLRWSPKESVAAFSDTAAQVKELFAAPSGTFTWKQSGWPSELKHLWEPGAYNEMTKGLVMSFEADHGLTVTGKRTSALWASLLSVLASSSRNTGGYNFAVASKKQPESLTIWHDGRVVFRSSMNTGIAQAPTPDGVFPVYARFRREVMKGTNPDGSKYADPVQYVAYFYDGDAVHYIQRADYGIPQSLGCVELPLASAAHAWPWLAYGTIVDVIS